jgi:molybdopterin-guanine dinucleotide biosynthesis protein A
MKNLNNKVTGILLAGGMSSRMGREKGSLRIGGRMLYEYPLRALEMVCDQILISTSNSFPGILTHTTVCDEIRGIGPMGGIHACLERSSTDLNLVLSYDLPLVNVGLLNYLLEKSGDWDMVAPAVQTGRPEPLCALYRKSMSSVFRALIEEKRFAVHGAISRVRSQVLLIQPGMPFFHPGLFLNINRREDLERLPENFGNDS